MGNVAISGSALASDYCWTSPQQYLLDIIPLLTGNLANVGTFINFGNQIPSLVNEDKPWLRTNPDGTPDKWYVFSNGLWLSKHPDFVGKVVMYEGTEASIPLLDGGTATPDPPNTIAGPFWEKVDEMDARSPIGPGTLPSGATIAVGDDLGEEKHVQLAAELVGHMHTIPAYTSGSIAGDGGAILNQPDPGTNFQGNTDTTGGTPPDGMNVIHPVHGIWFIRRTSRLYYTYP